METQPAYQSAASEMLKVARMKLPVVTAHSSGRQSYFLAPTTTKSDLLLAKFQNLLAREGLPKDTVLLGLAVVVNQHGYCRAGGATGK